MAFIPSRQTYLSWRCISHGKHDVGLHPAILNMIQTNWCLSCGCLFLVRLVTHNDENSDRRRPPIINVAPAPPRGMRTARLWWVMLYRLHHGVRARMLPIVARCFHHENSKSRTTIKCCWSWWWFRNDVCRSWWRCFYHVCASMSGAQPPAHLFVPQNVIDSMFFSPCRKVLLFIMM